MPQTQKTENLIKVIKGLMFLTLLTPLVVVPKSFFPFIFWKAILLRILVEIMVVVYVLLILENKKYLPSRSCLTWSVAIFLAVLVLTTLTSLNPYNSFWSNQERMEGLATMLHFGALFFILAGVFKQKEDWFWFFKVSFGASLATTFYALLQRMNLSWSWVLFQGVTRLASTIGNPAFFAAYLIPHIFLGIFLAAKAHSRGWRLFYLGGACLELMVLYWTATRGALLGLLAAALFFLMFLFLQKTRRIYKLTALGFLVVAVCIGLLLYAFRDSALLKKSPAIWRLTHISLDPTTDSSTQTRLLAWKVAGRAWQERFFLGWGPENYHLAFNAHFDPEFLTMPGETWYDRAHNKIFDVAVTSGTFGLASYLFIFGALIFLLLRHWLRNKRQDWLVPLFLALFLAYFLQNLFVFDTSSTYLVFFLLLGFVQIYTSRERTTPAVETKIRPEQRNALKLTQRHHLLVSLVVVVILITVIKLNLKPAVANYHLAMTFYSPDRETMLSHYQTAMFMKTFVQNEANKEFVKKLVESANFLKKSHKPLAPLNPLLSLAASQVKQKLKEDFHNLAHYIYLARLYNLIASSGDYTVIPETELLLARAKKIAPQRPEIYTELATTQVMQQKYQEAVATYQELISFTPQFVEAHWGLGVAAVLAGEGDIVLNEIHQVRDLSQMRLGTHDNNYVFTLAKIYNDLADYEHVINVFEEYLKTDPEDTQTWIYLAKAYAKVGNFSLAEEAVNKVLERQPERTSELEGLLQRLKTEPVQIFG